MLLRDFSKAVDQAEQVVIYTSEYAPPLFGPNIRFKIYFESFIGLISLKASQFFALRRRIHPRDNRPPWLAAAHDRDAFDEIDSAVNQR